MKTLQVQKAKIRDALEYFKHAIKDLKLNKVEKISLVLSTLLIANTYFSEQDNKFNFNTFSANISKNDFFKKYNRPYVFVLMYHKVLPDGSKINHPSVEVTESELKNQIRFLKDKGYKTLTLDKLFNFISFNTPIPEKSFVITFDDGYYNNYKYLYPILKANDMSAAIAVTTGNRPVDSKIRENNMPFTWNEARQMANSVEYASHTNGHADLKKLSKDEVTLRYELEESERQIKKHFGRESDVIIYPYGHYNDKVIEEAKKEYKMGFAIDNELNYSGDNIMKIKRFTVKSGQTGEDILNRVMLHAGAGSAKEALKDVIK